MEYRNAKHIGQNRIDCEINHPDRGWIPFTCDPEDTGARFDVAELHGRMAANPDTAPYIPPTQAELDEVASRQVRRQRDFILATQVDPMVSNPLRWAALSADQQHAWADYRIALLNVPQQAGFPQTVIWPVAPQ
jgi:hypothetical protein